HGHGRGPGPGRGDRHRHAPAPAGPSADGHQEPRALSYIDAPSPNFEPRTRPPDMVVLHYTGMVTGEAALERLRDPEAKVSSHYLVEEDGRIFRLVAEERRAWHAGVSFWKG